MKRLEELFRNEKELDLARRVIQFVTDSPFNEKEIGIPMSWIGRAMDTYCNRGTTYSIISELIGEKYFSCLEDDVYDDDLITLSNRIKK
ncbi:MAG: hypothetical protein V1886_02425 [archaeon]